jgi:hypothetical protein
MTPQPEPSVRRGQGPRIISHVSKLIQREVSYFNGWHVSEETLVKNCDEAARKILRYLKARPR